MRKWLFPLLLVIIVFLLYIGLTNSFYQQDEWHGMADILAQGPKSLLVSIGDPLQLLLGRGRVLSYALVYFFYSVFPFQVSQITFFVVTLHSVNTLLVYYLANKLTKNKIASFFGALFFAVNGTSYGSVTWPAAGLGLIPASFFIFLATIVYIKYLENHKKKLLLEIFGLLYLSLYFKETAVPLFILFPISHFIFIKTKINEFIKTYWIFIVFCGIAVAARFITFTSVPVQQDLFLTGATQSFMLTLLVRAILYPLTSFSLMFIPPTPTFEIAKRITWIYYPFLPPALYDLVAQTAVIDIIAVFLTMFFLIGIFSLFSKAGRTIKRCVLFLLLFITFSFLPYIIISKSFAYLESRYYYISVFGAGVLLSLVISRLGKVVKPFVYSASIFGLVLLLWVHAGEVSSAVKTQAILGQERRTLLENISTIKPSLNRSTIFYITGDRDYYIESGNPLPLQQGTGHTLLVWYAAHARADRHLTELLGKQYLWGIGEQGYQEVNGAGYGFYWDLNLLKSEIKNLKFKKEDVVGIYYDSKAQRVSNITNEIKW
jgi:hypothetical protein